jgi:hypothetical protein
MHGEPIVHPGVQPSENARVRGHQVGNLGLGKEERPSDRRQPGAAAEALPGTGPVMARPSVRADDAEGWNFAHILSFNSSVVGYFDFVHWLAWLLIFLP